MNSYADNERIIDLKDLLYRTFRKWRRIIAGAVIIALLAALYQVADGLILMLDNEKMADAQDKYEIAIADHAATGERLRTNIANTRAQAANQQEYNDKSELMRIDPMNKWVGSFQMYIDSKYQIDPSLSYQNTDLTNRLVSAYYNYLRSGELYNEMLSEIHIVDEIRFLTELYAVSADPTTATVTINAIGKSEADLRKTFDFIKLKIAERCETIRSAIGDHSYEILTESVYSTIDLDLDAKQKENLLAVSEYANQIGELSQELIQWEKSPEPKQEFGVLHTVKRALKAIIIGGVVGLVIMICWYEAKYIISGCIKTENDLKKFGIPVIGYIRKDERKRHFHKIDLLVDRVFGRMHNTTMEQDCMLTARSVSEVLRKQNLTDAVITGHIERSFAEDIVKRIETAEHGIRCCFAGDVLTEPETADRFGQTDRYILLVENQTTGLQAVDQMLSRLKAWGKTALGFVMVDQ